MRKNQPAKIQETLLLALRESGVETRSIHRNEIENRITSLLKKIYGEAEFKASVAASAIVDVLIMEGALVPLDPKTSSPKSAVSRPKQ